MILKPAFILFLLTSTAFSKDIRIPAGDFDAFKAALRDNDSCVIHLQGEYPFRERITVSGKKHIRLAGHGAKLHMDSASGFRFVGCKNITVSDLFLVDSSKVPGAFPFDFVACENSGLDSVRYSSARPVRRFVFVRSGSTRCFIRNCVIANVLQGVWLGDNGDGNSPDIEPDGRPTSDCRVENNLIEGFQTHGIVTRSRWNEFLPESRNASLRHSISGNTIRMPNVAGGYTESVSIEVWGSGVTVSGNTVTANPVHESFIGISFSKAYRPVCSNNRVSGAFRYQGIELATVNHGVVSGNRIDGVDNPSDPNSAGIGVSTSQVLEPVSVDNVLTGNVITGCRHAILLAGNHSRNTAIRNNEITRSTRYGIESTGAFYTATGNTFKDNDVCIHHIGGRTTDTASIIEANDFIGTRNQVVFNENPPGFGRPFLFKGNRVVGWGGAYYSEALVMRCGPSKISGNRFSRDLLPRKPPAGVPFCVATKSFSYGKVRHTFTGNILDSVPLSIPNIVGDKVGLNLVNFQNWYTNEDELPVK